MYTYRIVLDAYNTRSDSNGARVVTYSQGWSRNDALSKIHTIYVARDGSVSDGINPWPGSDNLPNGSHSARHLPEWKLVSIRTVAKPGESYVVADIRGEQS